MLKKAMLGILAVALLAGTESLFAQGRKARPKAGQKQKQAQKGQAKQKGLRPGQQGFDKWLTALTKAYRENDSEKMGQLLRNMNQRGRRQRAQKGQGEVGPGQLRRGRERPEKDWKALRGEPAGGKRQPKQLREREGRRGRSGYVGRGPRRGFEREGRGGGAFRREGRGERCRAFRGEGRRKDTKGFRGEGMRRGGRRFQGRGMGKRGRAFTEKVGHRRGPHGEARERFARGDDEPGYWGRGPRHRDRDMDEGRRGFRGRGQGKQYWDKHQEHMPGHGKHKSDFDWDW